MSLWLDDGRIAYWDYSKMEGTFVGGICGRLNLRTKNGFEQPILGVTPGTSVGNFTSFRVEIGKI